MFNDTEHTMVFFIMLIPTVAIIGGIAIGVMKALGQQRQIELAQRERIAAIERGLDPDKLPPMTPYAASLEALPAVWASQERARRQARGLMVGGILALSAGIGLVVLCVIVEEHGNSWATGILPIAIGLGLLLCAFLVQPRNGSGPQPPAPWRGPE